MTTSVSSLYGFPHVTSTNLSVCSAGQDATDAFYGLHRHEILERPQYQRLQIGYVDGETPSVNGRGVGQISKVPYAEPTWLAEGYHSPYYKEVRVDYAMVFVPCRHIDHLLCCFVEPPQVATSRPEVPR
jgi:hypothetical protein